MVAVEGVMVTVATGWRTVTSVDPCFPSIVAMMAAVPSARPVTTPDEETLAIDGALLDHATTRPPSGCPLELRATAVSWMVLPTLTLGDRGLMSTAATCSGRTETLAVPEFPSLVAVMVEVPAEMPVTTPVWDTVATSVLLDV